MSGGDGNSIEARRQFLSLSVTEGMTVPAIAEALGKPEGTVYRWRHELREDASAFLALCSEDTSSERLLQEIKSLRGQLVAASDTEAILREAVCSAISPLPIERKNRPQYAPAVLSRKPETAMLDLSDMQIGQLIRPEDVVGLNTYSIDVFRERLRALVGKVLSITDIERGGRPINHLVVNFGGDIVEGESIFPGQAFEIDTDGFGQVLVAVDELAAAVATFAAHFETVRCYCVRGNHGRVGRRGQHSRRLNLDMIAYAFMERALASHENVWLGIADGSFMAYEYPAGCVHVLMHGDQVRAWNGIPYYGIDRAASRLSGLLGMPIRYLHIGHHHQSANLPGVACERIANGSFVGTSQFSANELLVGDIPRQWYYGLDASGNKTWEFNLRLAEQRKLTPDANGVLFGIGGVECSS